MAEACRIAEIVQRNHCDGDGRSRRRSRTSSRRRGARIASIAIRSIRRSILNSRNLRRACVAVGRKRTRGIRARNRVRSGADIVQMNNDDVVPDVAAAVDIPVDGLRIPCAVIAGYVRSTTWIVTRSKGSDDD